MIESLRALVIFATVIEQGTFRAAARVLGLSASVVSHHVSSLEDRLGSPLLYRSTRRLELTSAGRTIYDQAQAMIAAAGSGLREAAAAGPSNGTLRVTMPLPLAATPVMAAISAFARENAQVELVLVLDDMNQNMIESGFDCAIRMGFFPASALPARLLFHEPRVVVASPDFVGGRAERWSIEELAAAPWIHFLPTPRTLEFHATGQNVRSVTIIPRVSTNSSIGVRELLLGGVGIGRLPVSMVEDDVRRGRLVELASDWHLRALPVFATWPTNESASGLVQGFVAHLAERLGNPSQADAGTRALVPPPGPGPTPPKAGASSG